MDTGSAVPPASPASRNSIALDPADPDAAAKAIGLLAASEGYLVDIIVAPGDTQYATVPDLDPIGELAEALQQASDRWKTLRIITSVEGAMWFFQSCAPTVVPNLEEFSLELLPTTPPFFFSSTYAMPILFHPTSNSIAVHLALRTHWVKFPSLFSSAITSLSLDLRPEEHKLTQLLDLLELCPNLRHLTMKAGCNSSRVFEDPAPPDRIVSLPRLITIVLDNLRHFSRLNCLNFSSSLQELVAYDFIWSLSNFTTLAATLPHCPLLLTVTLRGRDEKNTSALPVGLEPVPLPHAIKFDAEGTLKSEAFIERFHLPFVQDLRLTGLSSRAVSLLLENAPLVESVELVLFSPKISGTASEAPLIHSSLTSLTAHVMDTVRGIGEWELPALQYLSLSTNRTRAPPSIGSVLYAFLSANRSPLRVLHFYAMEVSGQGFISCLGMLRQLEEMRLIECRVTKEVLVQMSKSNTLPVLRRLYLVLRDTRSICLNDIIQLLRSRKKSGKPPLSGVVHFVDSRGVARKDIDVLTKSFGLDVTTGGLA